MLPYAYKRGPIVWVPCHYLLLHIPVLHNMAARMWALELTHCTRGCFLVPFPLVVKGGGGVTVFLCSSPLQAPSRWLFATCPYALQCPFARSFQFR